MNIQRVICAVSLKCLVWSSLNALTTDFPFQFLQCCLLKVKILHYVLTYVVTHIKIVLLPELGHKTKKMSVTSNVSDYIQPKSTQQIVISFVLCSNCL